MSEYDDFEDEDNDAPESTVDPTVSDGIKVEIGASALDSMARAVITHLVDRFASQIQRTVEKRINEAIAKAIDDKINTVIGERADAIIRDTLDKPRRKTNAWGQPTGPEVSFGEIIPEIASSYLDERVNSKGVREDYQNDKSPGGSTGSSRPWSGSRSTRRRRMLPARSPNRLARSSSSRSAGS